jgi:hypothetical protein
MYGFEPLLEGESLLSRVDVDVILKEEIASIHAPNKRFYELFRPLQFVFLNSEPPSSLQKYCMQLSAGSHNVVNNCNKLKIRRGHNKS